MLIITLARTEHFSSPSHIAPFVVRQLYSYTIASWWTTAFGAPDESVTRSMPVVLNVRCNNEDYIQVSSEALCLTTEKSWFLDGSGYSVHLDHSVVWEGVIFQYGIGTGYTDSGVVYIDDVEHLPLITSAPSIERAEDIVGYSKIRLISGSVELSNLSGVVDDLKTQNIVGNDAILSHLPNSAVVDGFSQRADVQDLARYFVESSALGNSAARLELQDLRALDKQVPTRFFDSTTYPYLSDSDDGKVVPLAYGQFRDLQATPITSNETGTTNATYRACEVLTSISQVRVKIGETWVFRPFAVDLANGTFTIPSARESAGKAPYECHVDGVGIPVTNAPDIIVDLYSRFLGQAFTSTFYDTTAWTTNKSGVPTCALVIKEQKPILDIIPIIQNGVYPGFRFDTPKGLRTIALDNRERAIDWFVDSVEVLNIDELSIVDNAENLYGVVIVDYDKSQASNYPRRITVDTYAQDVIEKYQWEDTSPPIESLLTNSTDAQAMAAAKALEFSNPIQTVDVILMGERFFGVELYHIMQVDTAPGRLETYTGDFSGRENFGVKVGQVIGFKPDFSDLSVRVTLRLLDRYPYYESYGILATEDLRIIQFSDNTILRG